jgi:carboxypeptidase C (cathepsin A)
LEITASALSSDVNAAGDERTAADSYLFLLGIMQRFPDLAKRPLWISGESYGGHYVPGLADAIIKVAVTPPFRLIRSKCTIHQLSVTSAIK